jgi:hypothetical protein
MRGLSTRPGLDTPVGKAEYVKADSRGHGLRQGILLRWQLLTENSMIQSEQTFT